MRTGGRKDQAGTLNAGSSRAGLGQKLGMVLFLSALARGNLVPL